MTCTQHIRDNCLIIIIKHKLMVHIYRKMSRMWCADAATEKIVFAYICQWNSSVFSSFL